MKTRLGMASALAAGSILFAGNALASDTVLGAIFGAGTGAVVGRAIGGRDGAIIGGAVGAAAGVAIANDHRGRRYETVTYVPPVYPSPPVYYAPPVSYASPVYTRRTQVYYVAPEVVYYRRPYARDGWHEHEWRRDNHRHHRHHRDDFGDRGGYRR